MNPPNTIASDTLVKAIARKQCEQHIREVRRWDTEPAKLEAMLPAAIDYSWQDHVALAQAALTAITEAGYAIVRDDELRMANGALSIHGMAPLIAIVSKEAE